MAFGAQVRGHSCQDRSAPLPRDLQLLEQQSRASSRGHQPVPSLVQRLKLHEGDKGENEIQKKLDEIFKKSRTGEAVVAAGGGDNNSLHSLHPLLVTNARITLEESLRDSIKKGYQEDSRWAEVMIQLESAQGRVTRIGNRDYRLSHGLLEIKVKDSEDRRPWRLVVPDVEDARRRIMEEIHAVPYAGHLGYHKTLKKLQQNFYWPDHTVDVRDYVLGCEVCQSEKSVHKVPAGLLQPLQLPEEKWSDVSLDFIMGLPVSERKNDGILTVVDRATKMVH